MNQMKVPDTVLSKRSASGQHGICSLCFRKVPHVYGEDFPSPCQPGGLTLEGAYLWGLQKIFRNSLFMNSRRCTEALLVHVHALL